MSAKRAGRGIEPTCCQACGQEFIDSGGDDPQCIRHKHHIIPQSYGGKYGPVSHLCNTDHSLLHAVADATIAGKETGSLLRGLSGNHLRAVEWLASKVVAAHNATINDPNKRVQVGALLTATEGKKLDQLKNALGHSSRETTIKYLINDYYTRLFKSTP